MRQKLMAAAAAATLWSVPALADHRATTTVETPPGTSTTTTTTTTQAAPPSELQAPDPALAADPTQPSYSSTPSLNPPPAEVATPTYDQDRYDGRDKESKADMRGLTVVLGGGVEGYSGDLAPQINPGPTWGVRAAIRPTKVLGLELGYSGAVNNIDNGRGEFTSGAVGGPDIVRNGGEAVATVGLTAAPVQPYLLGGVGLSHYRVRAAEGEGFHSDNTGSIPLGAGLRTHIGNFTADARFGYSVLFNNEFAENVSPRDLVGVNSTTGGRYAGTLNLGATF